MRAWLMKELRRALVVVPALVLVACLVGTWLTRGAMANLSFLKKHRSSSTLVDQRSWQTIEALAPLAVSSEEQSFAHEAERLADHDVDQAFAMALHEAAMKTRTVTGPAVALTQKVATLQETVKADQAKVDSLTAAVKGSAATLQSDDLDMAKAQLALDQDELADATTVLARASGDRRGEIQQELTAREAAMKKFDAAASSGGGQTAVVSAKRYATLYGRVSAWFDQRSRRDLLQQAKAEADATTAALTAQAADLQKKTNTAPAVASSTTDTTPPDATDSTVKTRVAQIAQTHALVQLRGIVDDRLQMQQQLSKVYQQWMDQLEIQHAIVVHLILQSLSAIAFMVLCAALLAAVVRILLQRSAMDRRRLHTLQTIASLGIQLVTLLLVLLVIFGAPSQVPTILGLATAGLTVVFQDFILAFFGWFVLMGRNGIRVGDWVEINGVGGEVIEIGLFRTALLETGNWTDTGHPTGRRVTFINNFAISGQYFNFSTSGQWMWDEISLNIPAGVDSYKAIAEIQKAVLKETEKNAEQATQEWQTASRANGLSQFTAAPSVDMRPAGAGIDIIVRYVTRAEDRFDMRNRLYQAIIQLLHNSKDTALMQTAKP